MEHYITPNGLPQTIRTDKGMAFTGKEIRDFCKSLNIKLIYGTPYIHTPTGLVERGIKTLKDYLRTKFEEGYVINEALGRSQNVMRTTVHSSIKETPFERHYGGKPRTQIHNYVNVSPNKQYNVSARPERLRVYSFTNGNGTYDQLIMKTSRKLKEDVSDIDVSPVYGRGLKKLIRDTENTSTPGTTINARPTTEDDPNVITVVDQNGNTDLIKSENRKPSENQNEQNLRKSSRLRSINPIN